MLRSGWKEEHRAASWSLQKSAMPRSRLDIKLNINFLGGRKVFKIQILKKSPFLLIQNLLRNMAAVDEM
jgi:hypothetical protein